MSEHEKVLLVDDDLKILEVYQLYLQDQFPIEIALGGTEALQALETKQTFAVIVADMQMADMDGIEFLIRAQEKAPDAVRIMLTGNPDQKIAMEAINKGHVYRFLTKPCPPSILALALESGLKQHRLITAERELLEKTLHGSIKVFTEILSIIEPQAFSHSQRLRDYMRRFTRTLQIARTWELEVAAMLSQVGYVTVPTALTEKFRAGADLTEAEQSVLDRVPQLGSDLLAKIPRLERIAQIVLYQNKNFDGTGFPPDNRSNERIPQGSRLLKLLSDLILLESQGYTKTDALETMRTHPGIYDPEILQAAFECFGKESPTAHPKKSVQAVRAKDLQLGQLLLSDVETKDGFLIITAGNQISPMLLMRLNNFAELRGLKEPIYVEQKTSDTSLRKRGS